MKSQHVKFKNSEIEVKDNVYYLDGTASFIVDKNYGCDADGNRGTEVSWFEMGNLVVMDEDGVYVDYNTEKEVLDYLENNWESFV